jgi:DNA-binding PadR family transcriptional regulator
MAYAVLGIAACKPDGIHGYALQNEVEAIAEEFWGINFGRVYRALDRLAAAGDLAAEREPQDGRPSRNVYRITEQGRQTLDDWLLQPLSSSPRPLREELSLKLLFLDTQNTEAFNRHIREQRGVYLDKLSRVRRRQRRLERVGINIRVVGMVMEGAEMRVQADLAWLDHLERVILEGS